MVNSGERSINIVNWTKPKVLTGLNQNGMQLGTEVKLSSVMGAEAAGG
jgi:hypothetical protein